MEGGGGGGGGYDFGLAFSGSASAGATNSNTTSSKGGGGTKYQSVSGGGLSGLAGLTKQQLMWITIGGVAVLAAGVFLVTWIFKR
jgi:hypothetical protein